MRTTALNSLLLCVCLLVHQGAAQASGGYAAYAGVGSSAASTSSGSEVINSVPSGGGALAPAPPLAPPRVPIPESANVVGPSLGYRPPPPPVRRDAESSGKCSFDSSKWVIEPQSAIAGAIMFDRTTGLSCEECLKKCTEFQDQSSKWVCRSLTYDNRWKICDLFAVDGNSQPYFLTEYDGRDYFAYQAALPPTDAQLNGEKTKDESDSDLLSKSSADTEEKAQSGSVGTQTAKEGAAASESKAEESQTQAASSGSLESVASQGTSESSHAAASQDASATSQTSADASHGSSTASQGTLAASQSSVAASQGASDASQGSVDASHRASDASQGSIGASDASQGSVAASQGAAQQTSASSSSSSSSSVATKQEYSVQESSSSQTSSSSHKESSSYSASSSSSSQREVPPSDVKADKTEYKAVRRVGSSKSGSKACQSDEVAHYADFSLFERNGESDETEMVPGKTREECVNACELEESTSCASAIFEPSGCKLSISRANHSDAKALSPSTSASYLEKVCLPAKLAKGLKKVFDAVPGHILVGHVQEVTDATSVKDCVAACLRAEHDFGFECKSVMWYPTDASQNCLLNTESRHTQPDVFVNEDQGVLMVYLDVPRNSAVKDNTLTMRFKDSPLSNPALSKWTRWSMCASSGDVTAMRHRYLKCTSRKDIRKCPKESVMCGHLPALQIKKLKSRKELFRPTSTTEQTTVGTCYAVKDSRGRKRCPHGLRVNAQGRREYCREPVDC